MESGGVEDDDGGVDLGFSKWIQNIKGKPCAYLFCLIRVQVLNFLLISLNGICFL